jgi:orotidine-5'-phosphate decarboxylase
MSTRKPIDPPVAIALDYANLDDAKRTIDLLADRVQVFKVGLQLFTAAGPAAVDAVRAAGRSVFLDVKAHDIPNTVAGCVRSAAGLGVRFLTIHGAGGRAMVQAAVGATHDGRPQLLVVSVLTSLDEPSMQATGIARGLSEQVDAMAALAVEEGASGLVCASSEIARVRAAHPDLFLLVPGMRPAWAATGDQKRTGTPAQAVADGADLIVLGRAVTAADDPGAAMDRVLFELQPGGFGGSPPDVQGVSV